MKKYLDISLSVLIILVVFYFGYSAIRTLNGNPVSMTKAEKLASKYIDQTFPVDDLIISEGTYAITTGNYYFDIKDSTGRKANEIVISKKLKTIEDTNLTRELNEKVKEYLSLILHPSIEIIEVNGTVIFSTSDQFKRTEKIWITLSSNELTSQKIADLGTTMTKWSKENGLFLNELIIDFNNLSTDENKRLSVNRDQFDETDYLELIDNH